MTRKKHLWIPLTIMLLASIAMVSVPVKPQANQTRLYIRESPPGSYIPGVTPPGYVWVTVDIESPLAWDNTADGIVGWVFSVRVDPDVLEPYSAHTADFGYFLYDFCDWYGYTNYTLSPPPVMDASNVVEFGEAIVGFEALGVGAGGNSTTGWWGEANGLGQLRFKSLSATAHTLIDIYDAYWVDVNGVKHAFDVVDDGQYNQVPAYLTVESTPFDGVDFTIDSTTDTTPATVELQPGTYTVTMPSSWMQVYGFVKWEDNSTNPVRTISMASNTTMTIIATYEYNGPPLEANLVGHSAWPEHHHFDISKHGNVSVPDAKGTPGYQTLFAKVKNIGEGYVLVKVEFELMIGLTPADEFPLVTNTTTIAPGEIITLTVDFAGIDGYPWDLGADDGKWSVKATCKYYQLGVGWLSGTKIKTFTFSAVP